MRQIFTVILAIWSFPALGHEYMKNVCLKQFNAAGQIETKMHAEYINYADDKIIITKPQVAQNNWYITAQRATTTANLKLISFAEDVIIKDSNDPTLSIKTSQLDYLVDQKLFTNEAYVVFKKHSATMSGYGLQANLPENRIKILKQVHTVLEVD